MIFSKGSKLHVIHDDHKYTYLISSASLTQSVREASYSQNTIQTPVLVDEAFVNEKSPVSISIDMHLGTDERFLFEWMGLTEQAVTGGMAGRYKISSGELDVSSSPTIYLESLGAVYKVSESVLSTCSFNLGPRTVASVSISGQGSKMELVPSIPNTANQTIQSSSTFYSSSISVAGITRLSGVTLEYTRDIKWVGRKTIHETGQVTYPFNPVVTRFAISGTINFYTDPEAPIYLEGIQSILLADKRYQFDFSRCMVSTRLDTSSSVHKTMVDYKLLPNNNSYINIT